MNLVLKLNIFAVTGLILCSSTAKGELPTRLADAFREDTAQMEGIVITAKTYIWNSATTTQEETNKLINKIGNIYPPNSTIRHVKTAPGKKNGFDVVYKVNEFGQRIQEHFAGRKKHLIVAGDSQTFGIGVKDSETLQMELAKDHPEYQPYNFGHGGGSANNTLALLENFPWDKNISEKSGKMIYLFSATWMFDRVMGTKDFISWDLGYSPWYYLKNDQLVYGGSFNDRFLTRVFRLINWIDRFHWIGDLPKVDIKNFRLVAKILLKMKQEYLMKFPEGEFTVAVSYFGNIKIHPMADQLIIWLKELGIETVGIQKTPAAHKAEHSLVDYHFNNLGQKAIAKELSEGIKF